MLFNFSYSKAYYLRTIVTIISVSMALVLAMSYPVADDELILKGTLSCFSVYLRNLLIF